MKIKYNHFRPIFAFLINNGTILMFIKTNFIKFYVFLWQFGKLWNINFDLSTQNENLA
jgi:hypothetical protein